MIYTAEANKDADRKFQEVRASALPCIAPMPPQRLEARNQLEQLAYDIKEFLVELPDVVRKENPDKPANIESLAAETLAWLHVRCVVAHGDGWRRKRARPPNALPRRSISAGPRCQKVQ